jgi:3-methyladenine DNA glycosylase AlkD
MKLTASNAQDRLRTSGNPEDATFLSRFFKTGPGEYGEGDRFLGVRVPVVRKLAREFKSLAIEEVAVLITSEWHEERLLALVLLTEKMPRVDESSRKQIFDFYVDHRAYINNWDLVDVSVGHVVGSYLSNRSRKPIDLLASSENLWDRRIAIVATSHFIAQNEFNDILRIAEILLEDKHDLIHKATGWMLREVGKRDVAMLEPFLRLHSITMPRTMLRYAIERLPETKRLAYLKARSL